MKLLKPIQSNPTPGQVLTAAIAEATPLWGHKLALLPSAWKSAGKSVFDAPGRAVKALMLLANEYRQYRLGEISHEELLAAYKALGLTERASMPDKEGLTSASNPFKVEVTGEFRLLDRFIGGGGDGSSPHEDLRIYFYWDEAKKQVVVGHLPSPLPNRLAFRNFARLGPSLN